MADPTNPLTSEHAAQLKQAQEQIKLAEGIIRRAKAAGLDFAAEEAQIATLKQQISGLQSGFFSTPRTKG